MVRHDQAKGLLVRALGHLNVLLPPPIPTREQIDFMVDMRPEGIWKG